MAEEETQTDETSSDSRAQPPARWKWIWFVLIVSIIGPLIGLVVDAKSVWEMISPARSAHVPTVEVLYERESDSDDFRPIADLDRTLKVGENIMLSVRWTGDGKKYLLAVHGDGSCRLWDFEDLGGALRLGPEDSDEIHWTLSGPEKTESLIVLGSSDPLDATELEEQIRAKGVNPIIPRGSFVIWDKRGTHVAKLRGGRDPTPWKDDGSLAWTDSIRELLNERGAVLGGHTLPCYK